MGRSSGQAWRISLRSSSVLDASENESASSTRTLAGAHAYGGTAAHRYDHRRFMFSGIGTTEDSARFLQDGKRTESSAEEGRGVSRCSGAHLRP